jgi:predicted NACHT family NTPase
MTPLTKSILSTTSAKNFITKSLDNAVENVTDKLKQTIQNRIIEYTVETARKCSYIKTILHKENISINKIYFPLKLKSETTQFLPSKVKDLFAENNKITIVGKGGCGKTTFIKYIYINSVKTNFKIPILLNLRDFNLIDLAENKKKKEIINNIFYKEVLSHLLFNKIGVSSDAIIQMFDSGKFLFILDGYDELNYNIKSYVLKDIEDFILRFSKNNYLITTRPYTDATNLSNFTSYEICGLDLQSEIKPFILQQLFKNTELANSIVEALKLSSSNQYLPLLTNPLFLILFLNSFESYPKLPPKKSTFYWQVFDALFEKHETFSKSGYRRPKISELKREDFEFVLNGFSFISYFHSKFNFDQLYIEKTLREIKKTYNKVFEPTDFLEDLKITLSILIEDGNDLSFIHRTLQEYFTARYLGVLNENGKHSFFKKLAHKQINESSHNFLLELISELYPSEYSQYYLPEHMLIFLEKFDYTFTSENLTSEDCNNTLSAFKNLKELVYFSKDISYMFNLSLEHNKNNYSQSKADLISKKCNNLTDDIVKMLIMYRNKENLKEKIEMHFKRITENNLPFIDFALYQIDN